MAVDRRTFGVEMWEIGNAAGDTLSDFESRS
jgi:hypothetical protein